MENLKQQYKVVGQLVTNPEPKRLGNTTVYTSQNNHSQSAYREYISGPRIVMTYTGKHKPHGIRVCKGSKLAKPEVLVPVEEPVEVKRARIMATIIKLRTEIRIRAVDAKRKQDKLMMKVIAGIAHNMVNTANTRKQQIVSQRARDLNVDKKYLNADMCMARKGVLMIAM